MSDEDDFFRPPPKSPVAKSVFASILTTLILFSTLVILQQKGLLPIGSLGSAPAAVEEPAADVPPLRGMRPDQARTTLNGLGLLLVLAAERDSAQYPAGVIAEQTPLPGSQARKGSAVQAFVSRGQQQVKVPELSGLKAEDAERQLVSAGLVIGPRKTVFSEVVPDGAVAATEPAAASMLVAQSQVTLLVSSGSASKPIPKVTGLRLRAAKELLEEQGFKVGKIRRDSDGDRPVGVILEQRPAPPTPMTPGALVDLVVNED